MVEAAEYTTKNLTLFQKIEPSFSAYIKAYASSPDRILPRQLRDRLHLEYNQRVRYITESSDLYKNAVYKIIGRCDLSKKSLPNVITLAEDYIWLQLALCQEPIEDADDSVGLYTLQDLQNIILQFGPRHFNPRGTSSGIYFQMLLLSGQFERAIHYLYSYAPIDATHFAIAASYHGLLRPHSNIESQGNELLILDRDHSGNEISQLNFSNLIGSYAHSVSSISAICAAEYLYLITLNCDLPGSIAEDQKKACQDAITDLVLESKDFSGLLGDLSSNGVRIAGALERRMSLLRLSSEDDFLRTITEKAAAIADQDRRSADAVLLYHLSGNFDTVVAIINRTLGDTFADPLLLPTTNTDESNISLSASENPYKLARDMITVYGSNTAIFRDISQQNRKTCNTLLSMIDAKTLYENKQWEDCIALLDRLAIIPTSNQDISAVKRLTQEYTRLDESISKNIPSLLVIAMECMCKTFEHLKQSLYEDAGRLGKMSYIRESTRNIMIYAGMIQFRMPSEIYNKLNALSANLV